MCRKLICLASLVLVLAVTVGTAEAVTNFNNANGDSNFNDAGNWDNGLPTGGNDGIISNGLTAIHSDGTLVNTNTAMVTVGADGAAGTLNIANGSLETESGTPGYRVGVGAGSVGTLNIDNGGILIVKGAGADILLGDPAGGYGEINVLDGGELQSRKALEIVNGRISYSAHSVNTNSVRDELVVDNSGTLAFEIDGDTVATIPGSSLIIELGSNSTLELTLKGDYSIGDSWILITGISTFTGVDGGDGTGEFGNVTNTQGYGFKIDYDTANGNLVATFEGLATHAGNPSPEHGSVVESTWTTLSWDPGDFAVSHDVYIGESFNDVNDGVEGTFVGSQTARTLIVGFPTFPIPGGLVPGTTYYWRIDEVNEADPNSPWKGSVWNFRVPSEEAYDPDPADSAEFVPPDVTLSWMAGFGAQLHYVHFGDNLDDVNNAAAGALPQQDTTYTLGTLESGKTYYWRVDEFDAAGATHKGTVWSFTTVPEFEVTDPNLAAWWKLDEGQGTLAVDYSGHKAHGTFSATPQWVDGLYGPGLEFGRGDGVIYTLQDADPNGWPAYTVAVWARAGMLGQALWASVFNNNSSGDDFQIDVDGTNPGSYRFNAVGGNWLLGPVVEDWIHLAASCDGTSTTLYYNGDLVGTLGQVGHVFGQIAIGVNRVGDNSFTGVVDDMQVYTKALTQEQIKEIMRGDPRLAHGPSPGRSEIVDIRDISSLSWSAGDTAVSHDVYFGMDRGAVANATPSSPEFQGNQAGTSLSLAGLVEFGGGDYFWRIDEVEADGTVITGTIWKFTVPAVSRCHMPTTTISRVPRQPGR
jgi:hypothetical protein